LEDTGVLTKFLQIDMDGIKRDRSAQLENVLGTNVDSRKTELDEAKEIVTVQH
jgi:hypothetical protein